MECPKCASEKVRTLSSFPIIKRGGLVNIGRVSSCDGVEGFCKFLECLGGLSNCASATTKVKEVVLCVCDSCGRKFKS